MAPTPQEPVIVEENVSKKIRPPPGEEVVISGMSGIFPKSDSVQEFMENLFNRVDMVTSEDPRWVFNHPEVPKHLGKVNGMAKFDAQFFRVHYKQACSMEPMSRKLLEHAYSAIYDSGINPLQLRGKKVGVFIGSSFSESEKIVIYESIQRNGFGITGCNKSMYANRISYWMDGKGPSYTLDLACASSIACVEHAYRSISSGQCDAAIVGGCNLCMHPNVSLNFGRAGFLSLDGKTRCFDKNSDGYVRSDAISVFFMQKAKDAKRIYSEVYHAKTCVSSDDGQFLSIRQPNELQQFLEAFYSEIDVSSDSVEYIEANGAASVEADTNELKALGLVFTKNKPIKIGCVKSNMGSSEPASGLCGLTKACIAYHTGKIPGNLHYDNPLEIPEIKDGKIQVLTDSEEFNRGYAALNSLSYTGANVHVLLKAHYKPKDLSYYKNSIPYLVLLSGRQEDCTENILNKLKKNSLDPEQIGLIHNIHKYEIPGHMSRGYSILDTNDRNETVCLSQNVQYCSGNARPIWFVYSGMGSQWAGMGTELMRVPIFAAAIEKCHKVLEPKGIDIVNIVTNPDKNIFDNILHSFVGIAAIQIGLTDVLRELGIVPDNIIGHSVGELGCAYADGCFSAEEMILSAYSRGLVSVQTPFIKGSMAAIGLGYKAILPMCPPNIEVACHNSDESCTISGPVDVMKEFVAELTSQGIFAKEVPCSNIAFHSRYIAEGGPELLKYLKEVIKEPKPRSEKWVSTSIPEEKWNNPIAQYSSAEYHTNNLLNPVLFEETSKFIPNDALVIEIAPHGLLQAILKRSLSECVHIPLTRRGAADPVKFLLEAIGKLYQAGLNPEIDILYPKIKFPVSTGTPFLSHYVEWEHSEDWPEAKYFNRDRKVATIRDFTMSIHDDDYKYFTGFHRGGNIVFPEAALLYLAWETLGMHKGVNYKDLSVSFKKVSFHNEAIIHTDRFLKFSIMIHKGSNRFEITYEDSPIVTGYINDDIKTNDNARKVHKTDEKDYIFLNRNDIYTMMRLRGYCYNNEFQSIHSSNSQRTKASLVWNENWVTFIDSILQLNAFSRNHEGISLPSTIRTLSINIEQHKKHTEVTTGDITFINADLYKIYDYTKCGGVEVEGLVFKDIPQISLERKPDVMLNRKFVPHFLPELTEIKTAFESNLQIAADNFEGKKVDVTAILSSATNPAYVNLIKDIATTLPSVEYVFKSEIDNDTKLVIMDNLLGDDKKMDFVYKTLPTNAFIITFEKYEKKMNPNYENFSIISMMNLKKEKIVLVKKLDDKIENVTYMPVIQDRTFSWVNKLKATLNETEKVVLVSERQPICGLLDMVKKLREEYGNKIGLVLIDDYSVISFDPQQNIYKEQLRKGLSINVLVKGNWGGYYYVSDSKTLNLENIQLSVPKPCDLDSVHWVEQTPTPDNNLQIQVSYAGPSYRDAQNASSKTNANHNYGMDFSGINNRGEKVMGLVPEGALSSTVDADLDLLWPVPNHWSLEDAATVPLPYVLAYYCLVIRTNIQESTKVFVNGGSGALGQAVISICLSLNCTVYTTVSDLKKKEFLLRLFPQLDANNIRQSSDPYFQDMVRSSTNDLRCQFVINCASGPVRWSAMNCVGYNSDMLDLNEYDMKCNEEFGLNFLLLSTNYISVQLKTLFQPEFADEKTLIQKLISNGIANGIVRPLSRIVFSPANVSRAFRLLSLSKHRGRVLIKMRNVKALTEEFNVTSRMTYSSKGTYIVVCDKTAIGMELADRLVKRGARKLIINIKPNSIAGYCYTKFLSWNKSNVSVNISSEDLQLEKGCVDLLKEGATLGPILGIFIVQNFNTNESFDYENISVKFNNTACVVNNLDMTSRNVCNELEHFVVLNHSAGGVTDEYMMSVTEKICQARNDIGLPALVQRVGLLKEIDEVISTDSKIQPQSIYTALNALETSLKLKYNNIISYNLKKDEASVLLAKIARIIGLKNINDIDENLSLKNFFVNENLIDEINEAIREAYGINYPAEKLQDMTVARLKNLQKDIFKTGSEFNNGLGAFFKQIEEDECIAGEPMVTMATSFSNIMEEEDMDPKATYLMLLPGFESHHDIFTTICERLKVQAVAFQYGAELTNADVPEIAAFIKKFMKKRIELKSKFYLLGYSFGVNVALELASLFEKEGHVGVVYCLDSGPDVLGTQLDAYVGYLSDSQLQNSLIHHMYKLISGQEGKGLFQELKNKESWNDKIELCINTLRTKVNYSHQYMKCLIQGAYNRIILAREYRPKFKLQSELVLIKGVTHPKVEKLPEDYGLSKYSHKPIQVFDIASEHTTAAQDCRVTNIVNKLLEPKLLEAFKNKNLCLSYLTEQLKGI